MDDRERLALLVAIFRFGVFPGLNLAQLNR
jgi:hypothetical protein